MTTLKKPVLRTQLEDEYLLTSGFSSPSRYFVSLSGSESQSNLFSCERFRFIYRRKLTKVNFLHHHLSK
jgi:hypothetical protein